MTINIISAIYAAGLGLCFGSFALATAWRIKNKKDFVREHSECEHCHHTLAAKDLIPLVSWILLRGKCRYCQKPITKLLPIAEITGAVFFAVSYYFWPHQLHSGLSIVQAIMWAVSLVLLLILFFYDLQWYLLPNKVMYPLWWVSGLYAFVAYLQKPTLQTVALTAAAVAVGWGLFYAFYVISQGKWIGFGDVRLGFAIGLLCGTPALAAVALFAASLVGIVATLPSILLRKRSLQSKVPFGPLLIIGLILAVIFGQQLIDWYMNTVLLLA